jgi:urease accessory protein
VLQLADAAFPAGGFAHSGGLEAAAQLGEIASVGDLGAFVDASIWQAGRQALPLLGAAHDEPERLAELDAMCDAMLVSHVANRASRSQGRAFVSTSVRVFDDKTVSTIDEACRARELRVHIGPAVGAVSRALGVARLDAMALHLHGSLRTILSAAVRLGLVGPHEAQRMTYERASLLDRILATCANIPPEAAAQPAPLLDLFGMAHDRFDVRLFTS